MNGKYRPIWITKKGFLKVIDQTKLPHKQETVTLKTAEDTVIAIKDMIIRGAGVIGCVGAFGVYLAIRETKKINENFNSKVEAIRKSRPTAVNLMWAVDKMIETLKNNSENLVEIALAEAINITDEEARKSKIIAKYGADIIEDILKDKEEKSINILTHCNAGWLAVLDMGTALAPIYEAKNRGIDVHVWVDETRPRNQGANLTAWELKKEGIKHTIIADNTGGHLMQHDLVDMVITGADRVSRQGDVANKIGTYLKALSAKDNKIPFYVALPSSTFDFNIIDGINEIPIETRSEDEVKYMRGINSNGELEEILITPKNSPALNYGFDVTPRRLITGLITERGVIRPIQRLIESKFRDLLPV